MIFSPLVQSFLGLHLGYSFQILIQINSNQSKKMKKIILIFSMFLTGLSAEAQGVTFAEKTLGEVLEQAKSENKLIFLDAYTTWCGPCKMMVKNVFPQKEVGDYMNPNFISISIDMEKGEGIELAKKYGITAYPTLLFLNTEGKVLHTKVGGIDAPTFIEEAKIAKDPSKQLNFLEQRYKEGDREIAFMSNYIKALYGAYKIPELQKVGSEFMSSMTEDNYATEEGFTILAYTGIAYKGKEYNYIIKNSDVFISNKKIGKESYDYAISGAIMKYLRKVSKEGTVDQLRNAIAETKQDYSFGKEQEKVENYLFNECYKANKLYKIWLDNVTAEAKKAAETDKEMAKMIYLNPIYAIAKDPVFKGNKEVFKSAVKILDEVLKIDEKSDTAYFWLATLNKNEGYKKDAMKAINTYLSIVGESDNKTKGLKLKGEIETMI